jgi:putative endonuclease
MALPQRRGHAGEAIAAAYFELLGCRVLERNARLAGVEVDLVVADGEARVLVEVKLRSRADFGGAAGAIDRTKRERLLRAARALLAGGGPLRIDVVALEPVDGGLVVRHYRDAVHE